MSDWLSNDTHLITPGPMQRAWKSALPVGGGVVGVTTVVVGVTTVNVNAVDLVMDPATEVTLIVWLPAGVDESVLIARVVEHVKMQEVWVYVPVAPAGSPDTENTAD